MQRERKEGINQNHHLSDGRKEKIADRLEERGQREMSEKERNE